jgi:hypothetical protein
LDRVVNDSKPLTGKLVAGLADETEPAYTLILPVERPE